MMKVCVQGLWHLGSVTAASLASVGHDVVGLDADQKTIDGLNQGKAPLFEPGLDDLLQVGITKGRLRFATDIANAAADAEVLWITFDTPVDDDDRADVEFVLNQIKNVLPVLADGTVVLVSSQMPVGSIRKLEAFVCENLPNKQLSFACSPENLRLGKALDVFLKPDRIVVGVRTDDARRKLEQLLLPVTDRIEWMSVASAEMTKHAINAFLATSVTFANEIAAICELVGADAKEVERGLKTEMRIGPKAYLSPGGPFAGGTLARDIEFLGIESRAKQLVTPLLSSVRASNDEHKNWVRRKLLERFPELKGVQVAIWGLTYKPGTDTLRRSLAVELCDWLIEQGAAVHVYDPVVRELPERWSGRVISHARALDAVVGTDALVLGTEWPEFRQAAEELLSVANSNLVVIDANRHLQAAVASLGLKYVAVGTPLASGN
ncbi:UDPglucose 6-dehydrogenase [Methylobacter tundripaludum]|uniref:UDP-glucose 6-dehydrogenase n=2 Tax=Methylobacter tundripaludum TaxID=173365 RepID=A0A2S6H9P8_9GAMM|nr:UDPglucose 6-dehydrogenase [Methylobacter tundripaludum]